jgi:outer membrane lipoprotein-sorting protein
VITLALAALLDAGAGQAALERLATARARAAPLHGEFTQTKIAALFKQKLVSHGRFAVAPPAHLEWRYTDPDPSALVVDGGRAVVTQTGSEPMPYDLARHPGLAAVVQQLQLWLGGALDPHALAAEYAIETRSARSATRVRLVPQKAPLASRVRWIEIELDDAQGLPRAIEVVEPSGDRTLILLKISGAPRGR